MMNVKRMTQMMKRWKNAAPLAVLLAAAACGGGGASAGGGTPSVLPTANPTSSPTPAVGPTTNPSSGWRLTTYYTPVMSYYSGPPQTVTGCSDLQCTSRSVNLGTFPSDFVAQVKTEGTGKIAANSYLNWSADVGYWHDILPRDAQGNPLMPYLSAAADTSVPFGSLITISSCGADTATGTPTDASVCTRLRNPQWIVRDRFTAGTVGQHIDLYVGEQVSATFTQSAAFIDASGALLTMSAPVAPTTIWRPATSDTFQWILSTAFDTTANASVYDLDAFSTTAANVATLHTSGVHAVCYVNVGAFENWRPDASSFPASAIGAAYTGWTGENWLDIRRIDLLGPIMQSRIDLCKSKGFDAIEPDNIDGYSATTGFPLTAADQIVYNTWVATVAHERGMSIAQKNDDAQVSTLLPYFDFALTEDCWKQGWCSNMAPFRASGKAVFTVEYTDQWTSSAFTSSVCPQASSSGFVAVLKNRDLDAWRQPCT